MSDELLGKIEEIRRRFPVSYEEARKALDETSGNLVEALILLEKRAKNGPSREFMEKLQKLWERGNRSKIRVRKETRFWWKSLLPPGWSGLPWPRI